MIFGNFSGNGKRPEFVVVVFSNVRQFENLVSVFRIKGSLKNAKQCMAELWDISVL